MNFVASRIRVGSTCSLNTLEVVIDTHAVVISNQNRVMDQNFKAFQIIFDQLTVAAVEIRSMAAAIIFLTFSI